jgi:hypothetical protein
MLCWAGKLHQEPFAPNPIVDHFLSKFGDGTLPARGVCTAARAMCYQREQPAGIARLASCGSWGKHEHNMERDLHRFAQNYFDLNLEKYWVTVVSYEHAPSTEVLPYGVVRPSSLCCGRVTAGRTNPSTKQIGFTNTSAYARVQPYVSGCVFLRRSELMSMASRKNSGCPYSLCMSSCPHSMMLGMSALHIPVTMGTWHPFVNCGITYVIWIGPKTTR